MKHVNSSILRCALGIALGIVLVLWPEKAVEYLVITIGILFILPGVFSMITYFTREKNEYEPQPMFPIEGAGSILFGVWLVIMPGFFVSILMYILGALLIIAGVQQIIFLARARKWAPVSGGFYVIPVLLLLVGILILSYPFETVANTFMIFGIASIVYGIAELVHNYKFRKRLKEAGEP